jgi:hypothetical protein
MDEDSNASPGTPRRHIVIVEEPDDKKIFWGPNGPLRLRIKEKRSKINPDIGLPQNESLPPLVSSWTGVRFIDVEDLEKYERIRLPESWGS